MTWRRRKGGVGGWCAACPHRRRPAGQAACKPDPTTPTTLMVMGISHQVDVVLVLVRPLEGDDVLAAWRGEGGRAAGGAWAAAWRQRAGGTPGRPDPSRPRCRVGWCPAPAQPQPWGHSSHTQPSYPNPGPAPTQLSTLPRSPLRWCMIWTSRCTSSTSSGVLQGRGQGARGWEGGRVGAGVRPRDGAEGPRQSRVCVLRHGGCKG